VIDFRYHIVSLIAVFLALGIGVVMGTTVIERAIVSRLEGQLDGLNEEVKAERSDRRAAEDELAVWDRFANEGLPFFVGGRLDDRTVVVVAAEGVDESLIEAMATVMRQAGATVPAALVLTSKLDLREQTAREQLALIVGAPDTTTRTLWEYTATNLATRVGDAKLPGEEQTRVTDEVQRTLLGRLEQDGFLQIRRVDDPTGPADGIVPPQALVALLGANELRVPLNDFYLPFTFDVATGGRAVAGQATVADPRFVGAVRRDQAAAVSMSTVDNIDVAIGEFAAVVALQQAESGIYGAYGIGPGATSLVPQRVG
jgi:hypothetical protein